MPISMASVPMMWAATAATSQPGSTVGVDQSSSDNSSNSLRRLAHTAASASTVGSLGISVRVTGTPSH